MSSPFGLSTARRCFAASWLVVAVATLGCAGQRQRTEVTPKRTAEAPAALPGQPWHGPAQQFVVQSEELPIFVRRSGGTGHHVVVINGGPGQSHDYCESLEVLATTELGVLTYDQRGTGRTPHPATGDYRYPAQVEDLEAIRVHLDAPRLHLIGHSHGGLLALAYLATHPDRVGSLLLFGSSPLIAADADTATFEARIAARVATGALAPGYDDFAGSTDCAPYFHAVWPVYLHDPEFPMPSLLRRTHCDLTTFFRTTDVNASWDYSAAVADYAGPVAVLYGAADPFASESKSIPRHLIRASVEVTELARCGHYWEECLTTFSRQAAKFLARHL